MLGMWDAGDFGSLGFEIFEMWDVQDVGVRIGCMF